MSIQTELTRITNAKAAIKTAIEGKGVTVPDGTMLDGMAALIAGIEAGGGMKVCQGTFTPAEDTFMYTVEHGLGKMPRIYCFFLATTAKSGISSEANPTYRFVIGCDFWDIGPVFFLTKTSTLKADRISSRNFIGTLINSLSENSITFGAKGVNSSYSMFKANTEYMWFVAG